MWAVARWADTYLLPVASVSPPMERAFGFHGAGPNVLQARTGFSFTTAHNQQQFAELITGGGALRALQPGSRFNDST